MTKWNRKKKKVSDKKAVKSAKKTKARKQKARGHLATVRSNHHNYKEEE